MGWQHTQRLIRLAKIATIEALTLPTQSMKGLVLMSTPTNANNDRTKIKICCKLGVVVSRIENVVVQALAWVTRG